MPEVESVLFLVLGVGLLALMLWALADAAARPAPYYEAAGKWKKPYWVAVLAAVTGLFFVTGMNVLGLFGLGGAVAAIVYLVDVRPALQQLRRGPYA